MKINIEYSALSPAIQQKISLINSIIEKAVSSANPYQLVNEHIVLSNGNVCIGERQYNSTKRIISIAMGKASLAMTRAVVEKLKERLTQGVCVYKTKTGEVLGWPQVHLVQGAHPLPDDKSLRAGQAILAVLQNLIPEDLVIVSISGGASALVTTPRENVTLADIIQTNRLLLRCGASINEMNCVRKHLEILKGGGLLKACSPAKVEALLLSDVIGNDLSTIASGPTVPDPTTFQDAMEILVRYDLLAQVPESIVMCIKNGIKGYLPETVKPVDPLANLVHNTLIGSNSQAIDAAMQQAKAKGIQALCLDRQLTGEAKVAGMNFLNMSKDVSIGVEKDFMTIAGGETTVQVHGQGKGGRNLEVALSVVEAMQAEENAAFVTFASDGEDGPTDAAGAVVTSDTMNQARILGLNPQEYLQNNDAYSFFEQTGGLIKTGSTGTNVNDLTFYFKFA